MFLLTVPQPEWWDRFFACVWRDRQPDSCWIWTGPWDGCGYGMFSFNRITRQGRRTSAVRAHRFLIEQYRGKIPRHLVVLHKCDTPQCVNPHHLTIGTIDENMADRNSKGRQARGERNANAKLTTDQVIEIRALRSMEVAEVARAYGVSEPLIHNIWSRRIWRHI